MTRVIFIQADGTERILIGASGQTVMQVAVENETPGIVGDCGGCCSCATCHAYVDDAWATRLPAKSETEAMMLEGALDVRPNSRLTCQITLDPKLDGLVLHLPASQY